MLSNTDISELPISSSSVSYLEHKISWQKQRLHAAVELRLFGTVRYFRQLIAQHKTRLKEIKKSM